jgi:mannose-1-phosphate guanylyltransferase
VAARGALTEVGSDIRSAVVLVGGEGTRLRPLTETIPKPLVPLVDRPFLSHVLGHLAAHGVEEAILSSPYLEPAFGAYVAARTSTPRVRWLEEPMPLGTGGAVASAAQGLEDAFFVLNGDILTDLDLSELAAFHRARGSRCTIALAEVEDARPFGLVDLDAEGRLLAFREKPAEAIPGLINAGTYVLDPSVLADVPVDRAVSIEREVFPAAIAAGVPAFGFPSAAYWMDLGTPEKYLRASFDALEGRIGGLAYEAPWVDPAAEVSLRSHLGRWVVVGPGAAIEDDAEVEDSVVLAGARVGAGARISDSILGPGATVAAGATVLGAVLGEGAIVPAGVLTSGARVAAGSVLPG